MCERVFSVGFGPVLDSMFPAAGTHGWLPQKNWVVGPPQRRGRWIQFAQSPRLWHTNHEQAVSVWCHFFLSWTSSLSILSSVVSASTLSNHVLLTSTLYISVLVTFPHHMAIPSQSTNSNNSCDRLNFNQPYQFFTCHVSQGNTTHPSNHLLFQTLTQHRIARAWSHFHRSCYF